MPKIKNFLDKKVNAYIDNLFSGVGPTQQLYDLKEELVTNIKEKISDFITRGMDEEQAYKEAIISMGDLSGLVDDMRKLGQDTAKQTVYSTMTARISTLGIIAGLLLILFGIFTALMLYFMSEDNMAILGNGVFVIAGAVLLTYSLLTRETRRKYAMNKIRAGLYALSVGVILFSFFTSVASWFATSEMYISIASLMVFFLAGLGLLLYLLLTETDRRKL